MDEPGAREPDGETAEADVEAGIEAEVQAEVDAEAGDGSAAAAAPAFERPVDKFRRTAAGTAIAAGMFGLRDALEGRPEREETVMEVPAPSPLVDDDLDVVFDLDHPENSRVVIRRPADPSLS